MSTYELQPSAAQAKPLEPSGWDGLGSAVLLQNARWFTQIRWDVAALLASFGLLNAIWPHLLDDLGLTPQGPWPWILAAILAAGNTVFVLLLRPLKETVRRPIVAAIIWAQIALDLAILTVLVHQVGSTGTFVPFAYLFHISLACIFFTSRNSFLVMLLSAVLYLGTVALEASGVLPAPSIFASAFVPRHAPQREMLFALSAVFVWVVVWYLTSNISRAVRRRDQQLASANERLMRADQEKNLEVLRVTHDLKEPFAGIEGSIQALKTQQWDVIPDSVRAVIERIRVRSETLRERIKDILMLGELRAATGGSATLETADLRAILEAVRRDLADRAAQRGVTLTIDVPSITIVSDARQLHILFANLMANAIVYSPADNGRVTVTATEDAAPCVRVADNGIGISAKALPHIFDEFYRTPEAAKVNKMSTGLGLSIVRQVAQNLRLRIEVESEPGRGTTFTVTIPPAPSASTSL